MFLFLNPTNQYFFTLALINKNGQILVYKKIKAEYQQSEKLLTAVKNIVGTGLDLSKLLGIITVQGPGGFTSLRIGLATGNALAWSLQIPIIGVVSKDKVSECQSAEHQDNRSLDEKLMKLGLTKLKKIKYSSSWTKPVLPKYGSEPHITLKNQ